MINRFYGHIEEKMVIKYFIISDISKKRDVSKKYDQVFAGIKYHINKIDGSVVDNKDSWKEFDQLKNIDKKHYASDFYDASLNKYGVKCGTSLRSWENKGWIRSIDPYGWFQWYFRYYLGRSEDDQRQINRWKGIVSRFKDILIKMIKNDNDSPKIGQILLQWGYELKDLE